MYHVDPYSDDRVKEIGYDYIAVGRYRYPNVTPNMLSIGESLPPSRLIGIIRVPGSGDSFVGLEENCGVLNPILNIFPFEILWHRHCSKCTRFFLRRRSAVMSAFPQGALREL